MGASAARRAWRQSGDGSGRLLTRRASAPSVRMSYVTPAWPHRTTETAQATSERYRHSPATRSPDDQRVHEGEERGAQEGRPSARLLGLAILGESGAPKLLRPSKRLVKKALLSPIQGVIRVTGKHMVGHDRRQVATVARLLNPCVHRIRGGPSRHGEHHHRRRRSSSHYSVETEGPPLGQCAPGACTCRRNWS